MNDDDFANAGRLLKRGAVADVRRLLAPIENEKVTDAKVSHLLGVCEFRESKFEKAEEHFRNAVSLDGLFAESRYYIGLCLERQGRIQEARIEYGAVLVVKPNHALALKKLGNKVLPVAGAGGSAAPVTAQPAAASDAAAKLDREGLAKGIYTDRKSRFVYVVQWMVTFLFTVALVGTIATFLVGIAVPNLEFAIPIGILIGAFFGIANAGNIKKFK